eukprot:GILI01024569.1.p1 GENE.GILI01024569.1~~GILI01024569.1.p1  ORF type:complete len:292 (-),score=43.95 GILI01024569.1:64-903(-)
MEIEFFEQEVTHISASHFPTLRELQPKLQKEFKVKFRLPKAESKSASFKIEGPEANVKKCITKIDESITTGAPSSSAAAAVKPASSSSDGCVVSIAFGFEKPAHAKLRGPNGSRKEELERLVLSNYEGVNPSVKAVRAEVVIPPPTDLLSILITASLVFSAPLATSVSDAIIPLIQMSVDDFLAAKDLTKHLRSQTGGPVSAQPASSSLKIAKSAAASGSGGSAPSAITPVPVHDAKIAPLPVAVKSDPVQLTPVNPFDILQGIIDPMAPQRDMFVAVL